MSEAQQVFVGTLEAPPWPVGKRYPKAAKQMQLKVNGKPTEIAPSSTVQNLLDQLRLDCQQVVVERNRAIVPRQRFAEEFLADGDTLEIVHFVGGG
jgi:thiamine biosynthesis protein ThiS